MIIPIRRKDPDSVIDYTMDWGTKWLNGDTISTSAWIIPTGLTLVSESYSTTDTTVFISGGTEGITYRITNRITTAAGRTDDRSIDIKVETL